MTTTAQYTVNIVDAEGNIIESFGGGGGSGGDASAANQTTLISRSEDIRDYLKDIVGDNTSSADSTGTQNATTASDASSFDSARKRFTLTNRSDTNSLFVGLGYTVTASNWQYKLPPEATLVANITLDGRLVKERISILAASGTVDWTLVTTRRGVG